MDGALLVAAGTLLLTILGIAEYLFHKRNLRSVPIRIHVNGTRGKSGVTRLIAAGLQAGGIRTCAKTTGTLPRMIFPNGDEYPVFRPGRTNINEQIRIVCAAARAQAEALVIECMALQPHLQSICELKLIHSTHGVITNTRADHLDVMGPETIDVAKALAGTCPVKGKLFTAEQRYQGVLRDAALDRESEIVVVEDDEVAQVTWDELERFPYVEHPDNVALALKVCQDLGVAREVALCGMIDATPDPGVMTVYHVRRPQQHISFVNGFAANDPESTGKIWEMMIQRCGQQRRRIAVINCRADRMDRSEQLANACVEWSPADNYLVIGTATDVFARRASQIGIERQRIVQQENRSVDELIQQLGRLSGASAMIMGMGNIAGPGIQLAKHYNEQSSIDSTTQRQIAEAA